MLHHHDASLCFLFLWALVGNTEQGFLVYQPKKQNLDNTFPGSSIKTKIGTTFPGSTTKTQFLNNISWTVEQKNNHGGGVCADRGQTALISAFRLAFHT